MESAVWQPRLCDARISSASLKKPETQQVLRVSWPHWQQEVAPSSSHHGSTASGLCAGLLFENVSGEAVDVASPE